MLHITGHAQIAVKYILPLLQIELLDLDAQVVPVLRN